MQQGDSDTGSKGSTQKKKSQKNSHDLSWLGGLKIKA
jgi:hypothetical protein